MNIAKLLLPLTILLAISGTTVEPASADNQPATLIADYGCYDNYMCPGAQRRYPYWVPRNNCTPNRYVYRRYRHYRFPKHQRYYRRHHHGHCR